MTYDSSVLARQVSEILKLNQEDSLKLYKDLSQLSNGPVKDALHALSMTEKIQNGKPALKRYMACIKESCVRDAQYSTKEDADFLDDDAWLDARELPLFLGIVEAETPIRARQILSARNNVDKNVIELYNMTDGSRCK